VFTLHLPQLHVESVNGQWLSSGLIQFYRYITEAFGLYIIVQYSSTPDTRQLNKHAQ
jgi:hypothetical protein